MPHKQLTALRASAAISALLFVTAVGYAAARKQRHEPAQPAPACKISPVDAIKIALKRAPGRALFANFEFDDGKWIYGVMVASGKTIKEVEIDAMTGKVGDSETVTPDGEARELKNELTRAIGGKTLGVDTGKEKE